MIRSTARRLQVLLLLGSLGASAECLAAPSPTDAASLGAPDAAGELFDKGNAFYRQSHWAEAEVQFQKAWDLKQSFDVAANLGDCELQVGQNREAAEHLAFAVRAFPMSGKPALLERLLKRSAEARALTGTLHIRVDVKGAEVTVDGRSVGVAPIADEVFVDPGARVVETRLEGYDVGRVSVTAAKGAAQNVTVVMARKNGADPIVPPPNGPNKTLLIGGGVAAGLVTGAGVMFALLAAGKTTDADAKIAEFKSANLKNPCLTRSTDCNAIDSDRAAHDTLSNAALVSFVGAGVLAVGTLTYGLMAKPASTKPSQGVRLLPILGVAQSGVLLVGSW